MAAACVIAGFILSACANRQAKPPEPLQPIARIAVLPAIATAAPSPDLAQNGQPRYQGPMVLTGPGGRALSPADAARVGVGVAVVALVDNAIRSSRAEREAALANAVRAVDFRPAESLNSRLLARLKESGLNVEPIQDSPMVRSAREEGTYKAIANGADAVLDVRVGEYGYYSSMRAGGVSPMLTITTYLMSPATDEDQGGFTYYSDWRESKDSRWFTSPRHLTFADAADLVAHGDMAREGLEDILDKMIAKIVADTKRRAEGQPPADN